MLVLYSLLRLAHQPHPVHFISSSSGSQYSQDLSSYLRSEHFIGRTEKELEMFEVHTQKINADSMQQTA